MFHDEQMKQSQCVCGENARPRQRNCYRCHALANQVYRARMKHQAENLKIAFLQMIAQRTTLATLPETCNTKA